MVYKTRLMPPLPPRLIGVGLRCGANLTRHVIGSNAVTRGCWWRRRLGNSCRSDTDISNPNLMQEGGKGGWRPPCSSITQESWHFLLASSASAGFSCNQAISLQGKGDERLGGCSGCLLGSTWRGLRNTSPARLTQLGRTAMLQPGAGSTWGQCPTSTLRVSQGALPRTLRLSRMRKAQAYAAAAASRKSAESLLCPDQPVTALNKT